MERASSLRAALLGAALLAVPVAGHAQSVPSTEDVEALKAKIAALQEQIADLAAKVDALESAAGPKQEAPPPVSTAPVQAQVPAGAAGAGGPSGSLPFYGGPAAGSKVFNPDIAAIGDFIGVAGGSPGGGEPSLELHEAELSFQAVVDPYARADFFLTFGPDEVGIEEGFVSFPAAPGGLLLKAGKLRGDFGKVNTLHNHVLPFADRPLVTQNLTGGEEGLADYGVSLSRLVPNPWIFLEATGQVFQGRSEIFDGQTRGDLAYIGHLRAYQDLTDSSNVDIGGSIAYGGNDQGPGFHTRLLGIDATFRWRPLRRAIYRRVLGRAELVWSRREEVPGARNAFGLYASAEYQFARRWFLGGRYDYSERAADPAVVDKGASALLTYWPSEFSQIRGQYRYTRYGDGDTANEFLFQLLFAIGAHGAHPF
jgi:hypothetical protein